MMPMGARRAEREGEPVAFGPTVDLIQDAARITGEKPWRIRWDSGRKYSRLRFAIFLVAFEGGRTTQDIGTVFEIDHSSVSYGHQQAARIAGADRDYARLVADLRGAWAERKGEPAC